MTLQIDFHREKFKQLIIYVAQESEADPHFGATKLNKILYFADFKAFGILGTPITGASYQRLERGPAPRELLPVLRELEAEGAVERTERRYFNLLQKRIVARQAPNLEVFQPAELEIIGNVLAELRHLNASEVSALSHLEVGWQLSRPNEVISYAKVYISNRNLSPRELDEFRERVRDDSSRSSATG